MSRRSRRDWLREVIFEADTPTGKTFDVILLGAIILSVAIVALETVDAYKARWGATFIALEWLFTAIFTVEYALRLYCVRNPMRYARSFYGIVDLLAILPTYLSLFIPGSQSLLVIRALRLMRVFRVLKLARFVHEAATLRRALIRSRHKITVFITLVAIIVVIMSSLMYLIEGQRETPGFESLPACMYWAVVTMTTVGYGDVTPVTAAGKALSALMMLIGYSIIIVPTGFVTAELTQALPVSTKTCPECAREGHAADAAHCKWCGEPLDNALRTSELPTEGTP